MIHLRDYQNQCVHDIRSAYRSGRRAPLLVSPTGSGKTVMFAYISNGTSSKGRNVWILVHRQELVDQTCRTLHAFGVGHGVIAAGRTPDRTHRVQVASVQTLVRRLHIGLKPDLIIIDEAHHGTAGSWRKVLDANPQARILGVTATPERLDGRGLGEVYDEIVMGPQVRELIIGGHLAKPIYFAPPMVADLGSVHVSRGDFDNREVAQAMDKSAIIGDAVEHYSRICHGAPAVAFCASIAHAQHVADQFKAAGYKAATIDGTLDRDTRREVVRMLGDGRLNVLTSCEIINEGFDLPIVTAAILLRPTLSLGLHLQQIGRVLRPAPGKERAIILDHVGNLKRHGFAEDVRDWSLEGRKKQKRAKDKDPDNLDIRQCPECFCCHEKASQCPECGHIYEIKGRELEQRDGELIELQSTHECMCGAVFSAFNLRCPSCNRWTDPKREAKAEIGRARNLEQLTALARQRGYANPAKWAAHIIAARQRPRPSFH